MKVFNKLDLQLLQILNGVAEHVTTLPSASVAYKGRVVYLTTDNTLYFCNGTIWVKATGNNVSISKKNNGVITVTVDSTSTEITVYEHPNHSGDVTSSADGTTTIGANKVTNAKLAKMGANTIKGNNTASSSDALDLTVAQVKAMLGVPTVDSAMSDSSTNPVQNKIVKSYIDGLISGLGSALQFKGTIGTGGDITSLPNPHKVGDTYLVKTENTYVGSRCEVGDMIVCVRTGTVEANADWTVVQANWTAVAGDSTLAWNTEKTLATIGGITIKAKLPANPNTDRSVTSVDYHYSPVEDSNEILDADTNTYISSIKRDAKGHVTGIRHRELPANTDTKVTSADNHYTPTENSASQINAGTGNYVTGVKRDTKGHVTGVTTGSAATTSTPGLMSAADKNKLNTLNKVVFSEVPLTAGSNGSINTNATSLDKIRSIEFYSSDGERVWIDYALSVNSSHVVINWRSEIELTANSFIVRFAEIIS